MRFTTNSKALVAGSSAFACAVLGAAVLRRTRILSLARKVVVITGGSRGLGLALAQEFGGCGVRLVLAARDPEELERGKRLLMNERAMLRDEDVLLVPCDLTQPGQPEALIGQASARFGQVDVLINSAGVIHVGPADKHSLANYREAMEVNFFAALHATYAVLPQMLERADGSIVNITSIGGKVA